MSSQNCANSSEITASFPTTVEIDQGVPHAGVTVHSSVDPVATCLFSASLPADAATSAVGTASCAAAQRIPHASADAAVVASVFGAAASMPAGASSTVSTFPDASSHLAVAFPLHCTCHAVCTVASSVAASTAARGSLSSLTVRENGNKVYQEPSHNSSLCICRSENGTQQSGPDSPLGGEKKDEKSVETADTDSLQQQSAYSVSLNNVRARLRIVRGRRASAEDAAAGTGTVTMQQERTTAFNEPTESRACLQDAIEKVIRLAAESGARRLAGMVAGAAVPCAHQPRVQTEERTPCHPEAGRRRCPCESAAAIPTESDALGLQTNILKQCWFSPELEGYDQAPEADLCTFAGHSVACASVAQSGILCTPVGGAALCRRPQNSRVLLHVTQPGCAPAPVEKEGRCNAKGSCKRAEGKQRGLHAAEEGESPHVAAEGRRTSLVKDGAGRSQSRLPERVIESSGMAKGRAVTHLHDTLSDKAGLTQTLPQNGESAKTASFLPCIYDANANKRLLCQLTSSTPSAAVCDPAASRLNMRQGAAMEEETAFTPLSERPLSCVRKPNARLNSYATTGRINGREGDGRNEEGTPEVGENAVRWCPPRTNPPPSRTADTSKLDCSSLGQQLTSMTQWRPNKVRSIASPASEEAKLWLAARSSFEYGNLVCSASVFPGTQGLAPTSREPAAGLETTAAAAVYRAASGCDSATTSSEGSCPETEVEPGNSSACVGAKRTNSAVHLKGSLDAAAHAGAATVSVGRGPVKRGDVEHYVVAASAPIGAADRTCASLIAPSGVHCADRIGVPAAAAVDTVWLSRAPAKARRGVVVSPSPAPVAGGGTSCAPVPDLVCASAPGQAKARNHEKERSYTPFCASRTSDSTFCSSHRRRGSTAVACTSFAESPHMRLSATRQLYQALKADKQRKDHDCACSGAAAAAAAGAVAAHKRLEEMVAPPVPSTTLQLLLQAGKATQVAWTEGQRTRKESEASATRVVTAAQTDLCTKSTAAEGQTATEGATVSAEPQTANYAPEERGGLAGRAEHQEGAKAARARPEGEPVVMGRRRKEARAPVKKRTPEEVPAVRKVSQQLTTAAPTAAGRVADPGRVVGDEAARQRRVVKEMHLAPEDTTAAGTEGVTKKRTAIGGAAATEEDTVTEEGAAAGRIAAIQEETGGDWHQQAGTTPGSTLRAQEVTANRVSAAEHGATVQKKASSEDRGAAGDATKLGREAAEAEREEARHSQDVGEQGSGSRSSQQEEVGTVEGTQPREITEAKGNDKHGHAEHTVTRFIAVVESVSAGRSQTVSPLQKAMPANTIALEKPRDFLHATDVLTEYPGGEYTSVERHERHTANVTRLAAATASSARGRPTVGTENSALVSPGAIQAATKVAAPVTSASTANAAQPCDCLSLETAAESPLFPCLLLQRTDAKQITKQRERSLHAVSDSAKEQWWPYARPDALKRNFSVHAAPVNTKTEKWQQAAGSSLPYFKVKGNVPAEETGVGAAAASARTSQPGSPRAASFVAKKAVTAELTAQTVTSAEDRASALSRDALVAFGETALVGTQCGAATTLPESPATRATAVPLAVTLPFVRRCPRVADSTVAAFAKAASLAACAAAQSCCHAAVPAGPQAAPGASAVAQICAAAAGRVRPSASADDVEVAPSVSMKSAPPAAAAAGYLTPQEAGEVHLSPQSMVCYSCSSDADRALLRSSGSCRLLAPFCYKSAPSVSFRPCFHRLPSSTAARSKGRIFPGSPIGSASLNIRVTAAVAATRSPTPAKAAGRWPRSAAGPSNAETVDIALDTSTPPAAANDASGAAKRDKAANTAAAATTAATYTAAAALAEELAQPVETRRGSVESLCVFPPATAASSPEAARVAECGASCAAEENCYVEQQPIPRTLSARPTDSNTTHHSSTTRSSSSNSRANQGNSSISSNVVDRARSDCSSSSKAICRKNDINSRVTDLCCASPTASALSVDVDKAKADENISHQEAEEDAGSYSRLNLLPTTPGHICCRYYHCRLSRDRQIDGLTTQARQKHTDINTDQDSPLVHTCRVPVSAQNPQQQLAFPLQKQLQQQQRPAMQQRRHQGFQQQLQQHHGQQVQEVRQQSQQPGLQQEPQERTTVQELLHGHPTHSTRQQLEHTKLIQQHISRPLEQQQQRLAHVAHQQQRQQVPLNLQQTERVDGTQQLQTEQRLQQQQTPTGQGCYAQNWQVEQFRRLATQQNTPQRKQSATPREKEQHEQQEKQDVCSRFSEQPSGRISAVAVEYERATPVTRESASALPTRSQLQQKQQQQVRPRQQWEYTRQARHTQDVEQQRESPGREVQPQGQQRQLGEQRLRKQYQKWQAPQGCQLSPELCLQKQQPHGLVSEAQLDCCRNAGPAPNNTAVREFPEDFERQRTGETGCSYNNTNDRHISRSSSRSSSTSWSCGSGSSCCSDSGTRCNRRGPALCVHSAHDMRPPYVQAPLTEAYGEEAKHARSAASAQPHSYKEIQHSVRAVCTAALNAAPISADAAISSVETATVVGRGGIFGAGAATGNRAVAAGAAAAAVVRSEAAAASVMLGNTVGAGAGPAESCAATPSAVLSASSGPDRIAVADPHGVCYAPLLPSFLSSETAGASENCTGAPDGAEAAERGGTVHRDCTSASLDPVQQKQYVSLPGAAAGSTCWPSHVTEGSHRDQQDGGTLPVWGSPAATGDATAAAAHKGGAGTVVTAWPKKEQRAGAVVALQRARPICQAVVAVESACCRIGRGSETESAAVCPQETAETVAAAADARRRHSGEAPAAGTRMCSILSAGGFCRSGPLQHGRRSSSLSSALTPHELQRAAYHSTRRRGKRSSSCCSKIGGGSSNLSAVPARAEPTSRLAAGGGTAGAIGAAPAAGVGQCIAALSRERSAAAARASAVPEGGMLSQRRALRAATTQGIDHLWEADEHVPQQQVSSTESRGSPKHCVQPQLSSPLLLLQQLQREQQPQPQQPQQPRQQQLLRRWQPAFGYPLSQQHRRQHLPDTDGSVAPPKVSWRLRVSLPLQRPQPQLEQSPFGGEMQQQKQQHRQLCVQLPQTTNDLQRQHQHTRDQELLFIEQQQQRALLLAQQAPQGHQTILPPSTHIQPAHVVLQKRQRQTSDLLQKAQLTQKLAQPQTDTFVQQKPLQGELLQQPRRLHSLQQQMFEGRQGRPAAAEHRMQRRSRSEPRASVRPLEKQQDIMSYPSVAAAAVSRVSAGTAAAREDAASFCTGAPSSSLALLVNSIEEYTAGVADDNWRGSGLAGGCSRAGVPALTSSAVATPSVSLDDDVLLQQQSPSAVAAATATERHMDWEARVEAAKQRTRDSLRHMLERDKKSFLIITPAFTNRQSVSRCCCCCAHCCHRWKSLTMKQRQRYRAAAIWLLTGVLLALCAVAMVCIVVMKMLLHQEVQV